MKCNDWDPDPFSNLGLPLQECDEVCRWWLGGKACRLYNRGSCETEGRQSLPERVQCPELDIGKVLDPVQLEFLFEKLRENLERPLTEIGNLEIDFTPAPQKYGLKQARPKSTARNIKRVVNKK